METLRDAEPIIPPDLREKPRRPVNSNVGALNRDLVLSFNSFSVRGAERTDIGLPVAVLPAPTFKPQPKADHELLATGISLRKGFRITDRLHASQFLAGA